MDPKSSRSSGRKTTDGMRASAVPAPSAVSTSHRSRRSVTHKIIRILLIIILVAVIVCGAYGFANRHNLSGAQKDKYQAVFLTNGQVYFGRVSLANRDTVKISDIYYLQVQQSVQPQDADELLKDTTADTSLIKLGSELHGPEDEMYVPKSQILFWENLKDNGKVVDAIKNYQKK